MMRRGIGRAGRPGIVGTAARTAVIAGTATAVSNKVTMSQQAKAQQAAEAQAAQAQAEQVAAAPPPPAPASGGGLTPEVIEQLQQLGALREQGILTEEEFAAQKARLLG